MICRCSCNRPAASPEALQAATWILLNTPDGPEVEQAADVLLREHTCNTNLVYLTESKLGPYASRSARIYKCPSDRQPAPNGPRIRSMSMNAMVGNPGELTNRFNPLYRQFYKTAEVPNPSGIFVFLDELADTLNDGFFVNRLDEYAWGNVPGSYHNGAVSLSFVDGHRESHRWVVPDTVRPVRGARINSFPATPRTDFEWLKARTSVKKS